MSARLRVCCKDIPKSYSTGIRSLNVNRFERTFKRQLFSCTSRVNIDLVSASVVGKSTRSVPFKKAQSPFSQKKAHKNLYSLNVSRKAV